MLDISIPQLFQKLNKAEEFEQLANSYIEIEEKIDGVKLNIIKVGNSGTLNDWIVSYKGSIMFPGEFSYQTPEDVKKTIGNSQFQHVFNHLSTLKLRDYQGIPNNTEFFCELVVNKDTVMSEYTKTGNIILLGYSSTEYDVRFGKVYSNPMKFETHLNAQYAKQLGLSLAPLLFQGFLSPVESIQLNFGSYNVLQRLKENADKLSLCESNARDFLELVLKAILSTGSYYGGDMEGVVIRCKESIYKFQQSYQLDREQRVLKKLRFREESTDVEAIYWNRISEIANKISYSIETRDIQLGLTQIAEKIKELDVSGLHSKKNSPTVKDDIQHHAKNLFIKNLKGNNGGLVIGKFRIFTNGHIKMISKALEECDNVVIGLVTSKDSKDTRDLRYSALRTKYPEIEIIDVVSGNIITAMKKSGININRVYTGSDRLADYKRQLLKSPGTTAIEIPRTIEDISATKIIQRLDDFEFFCENVPEDVVDFYSSYKETYY